GHGARQHHHPEVAAAELRWSELRHGRQRDDDHGAHGHEADDHDIGGAEHLEELVVGDELQAPQRHRHDQEGAGGPGGHPHCCAPLTTTPPTYRSVEAVVQTPQPSAARTRSRWASVRWPPSSSDTISRAISATRSGPPGRNQRYDQLIAPRIVAIAIPASTSRSSPAATPSS